MALTTKYGNAGIGRLFTGKQAERERRRQQRRLANKKASYTSKPKKQKAATKANGFEHPPAYRRGMGDDFYRTREWRILRWQILDRTDGKCSMCGRGKAQGIILHVDHIHPRSIYPSKELDAANLQILCEDCNIGKGATTRKC
jgi:5-methylcytosine-specific restriction endonuclease McrA